MLLKKVQTNKTLFIYTGYKCNNNCIMCFKDKTDYFKYTNKKRLTKDIMLDIQKGKNAGFKYLEFIGGEPTIRDDIVDLTRYAHRLGFKNICLTTNGRIFSYRDFCNRIIESGLNSINISLHGHIAKIHDDIVRTPRTFKQIMQGVVNIKRYKHVILEIKSVILKYNYKFLKDMKYFFFFVLGVDTWNISDLIPPGGGKADKNYRYLTLRPNILSDVLSDLGKVYKPKLIKFFEFPLCIFKPSFMNYNNLRFVQAEQVGDTEGIYKTKINICNSCFWMEKCGGIWQQYIDTYGKNEILNLAKKHHCIKN